MSEQEYSTFSIKLPTAFVDHLEQLRTEWGLESKGSVIERLLEEIFDESLEEDDDDEDLS